MSAQGFSGKFGTAKINGNKLCDLGKWTLEDSVAVSKYATNCTNGRKVAVAGVGDSKGTLEVKIQKNGKFQMIAGQTVDLELHSDTTGSNYLTVTAIIAGSPFEVDINEGAVVGCNFAFEGSGDIGRNGIFEIGDTGCCGSSSSSGE